jgi:hypothetical protein
MDDPRGAQHADSGAVKTSAAWSAMSNSAHEASRRRKICIKIPRPFSE